MQGMDKVTKYILNCLQNRDSTRINPNVYIIWCHITIVFHTQIAKRVNDMIQIITDRQIIMNENIYIYKCRH